MRFMLSLLVAGCLIAAEAHAQAYINPPPIPMPMDLQFSNVMISRANSRAAERAAEKRADRLVQPALAPSRSELRAARAALTFDVDQRLRAVVLRDMRERVAERSPEDAEAFSDGLFRLMDGALSGYGLSTDDLSDTTAVYLIEMWDAANGQASEMSKKTVRALSEQLARSYSVIGRDEPKLFDSAVVQEQSDRFLLQAYLITSLKKTYQQPGADSSERARFEEAMRELGREVFGIDLTRATIDERGLTPGEAIGALDDAVRESRAERAASDPAGEADRAVEAALGSPCGLASSGPTERKVLRLFEARGLCGQYDPARYDAFEAEVPEGQRYAINFMAWSTGRPLYPADQAKMMDGMIE